MARTTTFRSKVRSSIKKYDPPFLSIKSKVAINRVVDLDRRRRLISRYSKANKMNACDIVIPESRLSFNFGSTIPLVSIIIPMYKSNSVIIKQAESWDFEDNIAKEIIYVDDCCPNNSSKIISDFWDKKWKTNGPKNLSVSIFKNDTRGGYPIACNNGSKNAKGKYLIFLNADTTLTKNWIKPMIDLIESDSEIGIVGNLQMRNQFLDSAGSEWSGNCFHHIGKTYYKGRQLKFPFFAENIPDDLKVIGERQMVTGCCFAIKKDLWDSICGYDVKSFFIGYWEDSDLCMRVRALGYKIYYQPESVIYHDVGHTKSGGHSMLNTNIANFRNRWVSSGELERLNKKIEYISKPSPESIVVYTSITNAYDELKSPKELLEDVDFVAYLDSHTKPNDSWETRKIKEIGVDHNRNAKQYKIMPHIFFPEKEYSLWVDGSVKIICPYNIQRLVQVYLSNADLCIFKHSNRKCIYEEAITCKNRGLDNAKIINEQINRYKKEGYPENYGLAEATVILRRHSNAIRVFNEAWWEEICKGSKRDQISFNYVARKLGIKINHFPLNIELNNGLFVRQNHRRK